MSLRRCIGFVLPALAAPPVPQSSRVPEQLRVRVPVLVLVLLLQLFRELVSEVYLPLATVLLLLP